MRERRDRETAPEPENAQVEHDHCADKNYEADDMDDLDNRVHPRRLAHHFGETARLEPYEPSRSAGRVHLGLAHVCGDSVKTSLSQLNRLARDGDALRAHLLRIGAIRIALDLRRRARLKR